MAVIKAASSHSSIKNVILYITQKEKTEQKLISGLHCAPETAIEEMQATKELFGKTDGRTYKHFIQSFASGEQLTAEEAHAIAQEFAEKCRLLQGYEVLYATHVDRDHIHTHFIVNSVSYANGYKFHMSAADLQDMKDLSDSICREHGLSITQKGLTFDGHEREETTAYAMAKYKLLEKAENGEARSYVQETALQVLACRDQARSREEFVSLMQKNGYQVVWQENRKHIIFIDSEGHRVRNSNLERTFHMDFSKEGMQHVFAENLQRAKEQGLQQQQQHQRRAGVGQQYEQQQQLESAAERTAETVERIPVTPKVVKAGIRMAKTVRRVEREMQRTQEEAERERGRHR